MNFVFVSLDGVKVCLARTSSIPEPLAKRKS